MLSRVMNRGLVRGVGQMQRVAMPVNCVAFNQYSAQMTITKRNFQGHLGLDSTVDLVPAEFKATDQVSLWKDVKAK